MVGRRRRRDLRHAGEHDHADFQPVGRAVEEEPDRLLRGADAVRLDVARLHRARDIEHEHDGRAVLRHEPVDLRTRDADEQRREREQNEHRRYPPAPPTPDSDLAQNREVREAHRVARLSPLQHDEEQREQREREEREQEPRTLERHRPAPAQSACTWTTARVPRNAALVRTTTRTRPDATERVTETALRRVPLGAPCV